MDEPKKMNKDELVKFGENYLKLYGWYESEMTQFVREALSVMKSDKEK